MTKRSSAQLYIGLMSGTSLDGVDAALVKFTSAQHLSVIETLFTPYSQTLQSEIAALSTSDTNLNIHAEAVLQLDTSLAEIYAQCSLALIEKSGLKNKDITAIANHGQTIRHAPEANPAFSIQLGCSQLIADRTGILTIAQFRQGDLEVGGQGAPLMPAFHQAVFNQAGGATTAILNIGGIANITILNSANKGSVIGYDTGPGNTLMDCWINQHKNTCYDKNGDWAKSGNVVETMLNVLLNDPYFTQAFPKSTGTDYFNLNWLELLISNLNIYKPADIQATLLHLSCHSIASELAKIDSLDKVYLCGGGAHNIALIKQLKEELASVAILKTDDLGIPADWVEAVGFAWLGYCHHHRITSNLPSVTGALKAVVLGESFKPIQQS